jgi:predicted nucleic acid-binding protein
MTSHSLSRLDEADVILVLDASVVINLLGTGTADKIVRALGRRCVVERNAWREVTRDPLTGRSAAEPLGLLADVGLLERQQMQGAATTVFLDLSLAQPPEGLGDGEAATLAHAVKGGATAVIDEKKALRIGAAKFPELRLLATLDLLSVGSVAEALGRATLADAVFSALIHARMRVPSEFRKWVVDLIGRERALRSPSLGGGF